MQIYIYIGLEIFHRTSEFLLIQLEAVGGGLGGGSSSQSQRVGA